MSLTTQRYLLVILLCVPLILIIINTFAELRSYQAGIKAEKRRIEELKKQEERERQLEEERRRAFEASYSRYRGGRY